MRYRNSLGSDKHKTEFEAAEFKSKEIAEEKDAEFRLWLKNHMIEHPEDAQKKETELREIFHKK